MLNKEVTTLGIDIGGTKIAAAPFLNEQLIESDLIKKQTPQTCSEDIIEKMFAMFKELSPKHDFKAIGVSTAGVVNNNGEMVGSCGNIKGWKGTKVKAELERKTGLPVLVENDANCSAFGEYKVGCAREFDPVLLVIVGTGIGGGIVSDNKIWRGAHFAGGEIGHIKISHSNEKQCTCGAMDCWEAYASGPGLEKLAKERLGTVNEYDDLIDNYKLIERYRKGDPQALDVVNLWHEYLAIGMASMVNSFDPACVVVSGGMAQFIDYGVLNKLVSGKVVDALSPNVNIMQGVLGNDSGMVGAAALANMHFTN